MVYRDDWGQRVISKAQEYANYEWFAYEHNVKHGIDLSGRYVDTPDTSWKGEYLDCGWWRVNEINKGIPYSWANASTLKEFEIGIHNGKYAGNVPEDKKRYGSNETVGVDCSGLLTLCWELHSKIATKDIPKIATVVNHIKDIQLGDVFAKPGSHVMFFVDFTDVTKQEIIIIDATRSTGKVSQRQVQLNELIQAGYEIYRKL